MPGQASGQYTELRASQVELEATTVAEKKVAFITGVARGQGRAHAVKLDFGSGWQPVAGVGRILFSDHRFRVDRLRGRPDGDVAG